MKLEQLLTLDKLKVYGTLPVPGNENREFVINRYSRTAYSFWRPFTKIAVKSGIGEIVRPFDNMRASRSNEIHRAYGAKLESVWIGHSEQMAFDHYLMVTDDDYAVAAGNVAVQSVSQAEITRLSEVTQVRDGGFLTAVFANRCFERGSVFTARITAESTEI